VTMAGNIFTHRAAERVQSDSFLGLDLQA